MPEKPEHKNGLLYAETVLVPVANPDNAHSLIKLALALTHPEEGRVIVLTVTLGDMEKEAKTLDAIEPVCETFISKGHPVELQTRAASNIARGILDAAREEGADLIVLGLNRPERGEVVIGGIAENVASTAPCDVLLYRAGIRDGAFERIVVPANGTDHSRIAARVGVQLGESYHRPVEAMYVQGSDLPSWQGHGRLAEALEGVAGAEKVRRTLVTARHPTSAILARVDDKDLLVIGYVRRNEVRRWLYGDFSRELLNRAPGPVVLTAQLTEPESDDALHQRIIRWLRPTLTPVEQDELTRQAHEMAVPTLDYTVLTLVSTILSTFALLISSSAGVIAAMLVSPLMSPLIAFTVGMTTGRVQLLKRSTISVVQGFLLTFPIALLIGMISPTKIVTAEMTVWGNPTLLDLGVALATGFIGAYALARKDIPEVLAGVAVASAFTPPVCTLALGLAYGDIALARGAALLFATNIVCIILAAWFVFFWLGMHPEVIAESRVRQYTSAGLVVLFVGLLGAFLLGNTTPTGVEATIEQSLRSTFTRDELVRFEVRRSDPLQVIATVRRASSRLNDHSEVVTAQRALEQALDQPVDLNIVIEPFYNVAVIEAQSVLRAVLDPVPLIDVQVRNTAVGFDIHAFVAPADLAAAQGQQETAQKALAGALDRAVVLTIDSGTG